jgi:hypothetical protein
VSAKIASKIIYESNENNIEFGKLLIQSSNVILGDSLDIYVNDTLVKTFVIDSKIISFTI